LTGCTIVLVILAILFAGYFTREAWLPFFTNTVKSVGQTVQNAAPTAAQPGAPQAQPVAPGSRQEVKVCFLNFPSYLPVILIPQLQNQAYTPVLYPLQFPLPDGTETKGSEPEQVAMMKAGECDVLLTTPDTLTKYPSMGRGITIVDQSDGADKTVAWNIGRTPGCAGKPINIFNDLAGCTIATTGGTVSEFQALSFLQLAGLTVGDVNLDTSYASAEDAVNAFLSGKADAVPAWSPDVDAAVRPDTKVLVSSAYLHTIYDTIVVSPKADAEKREAITAFLADWFAALKFMVADPDASSQAIAAWTYQGAPSNDWTYVYPETAADDMAIGLELIAQAGFDHNLIYLANPDLLTNMADYERKVWEWGGSQLESPFDPARTFDMSYLQAISNRGDLRPAAGQKFVNNTFSPFPPDQAVPTADQLIKLPTVAEFGCPGFAFQPGNVALDPSSADYGNFVVCAERLLQLVNQADVQILITGSAASPDPLVFGSKYTPAYSLEVANQRAVGVMAAMINMGFPGNRLGTNAVIGPVRSVSAELQQDRWVKIEIKASDSSLR
jgi:ABC-type nitrate/sulfonate/bicarbonate transport system substrate-binding protein